MSLLELLGLRPSGTADEEEGRRRDKDKDKDKGKGRDGPDDKPAETAGKAGKPDETDEQRKARKAYEAAYAKRSGLIAEGQALLKGPVVPVTVIANQFTKALSSHDLKVYEKRWEEATDLVGELATAAQRLKDSQVLSAAYAPVKAQAEWMLQGGCPKALYESLPEAQRNALLVAVKGFNDEAGAGRIDTAQVKLGEITQALKNLGASIAKGNPAMNAYLAGVHIIDKADAVDDELRKTPPTDARMIGLVQRYRDLYDVKPLITKGDWKKLAAVVPELIDVSKQMIEAQAERETESAPFNVVYQAAKDDLGDKLTKADQALNKPDPLTSALEQAYRAAWEPLRDAINAADFKKATGLVDAWKKAARDLAAARDAVKSEVDDKQPDAKDFAEVASLVAAGLPSTVAVGAFQSADKDWKAARAGSDLALAKAAARALRKAVTDALAARAETNRKAGDGDFAAVAEARDKLAKTLPSNSAVKTAAFVGDLYASVLQDRSRIDDAITKKDLVAARLALATTEKSLKACKAAIDEAERCKADFAAAKNGAIATARALVLQPAALAALRDKSLKEAEDAIAKAIDDGRIALADQLVARWLAQAPGWKKSQQAYVDLHGSQTPKVDNLKALAREPGGDAVLDALFASLPHGTHASVGAAALEARFGVKIKRLKAKPAVTTKTKGLPPLDLKQQDDEVKKIYEVLSRIPRGQLKGKMKKILAFDEDAGGGSFSPSTRKIYLYAGRMGDDKKVEKMGHNLLPAGEVLPEDCQPDPKAPEIPRADFTLLHEAGHAEDHGASFMLTHMAGAGFGAWRKETPASVAAVAAKHLQFDEAYILATLKSKNNQPPGTVPDAKGVDKTEWETRRRKAVDWCRAIRAMSSPWEYPAVCREVSIGGRVYQEAYANGRWNSYELSARGQGITGYQFRAPGEWFSELYAAHFAGKLKASHPAMEWLKDFKPPKAA